MESAPDPGSDATAGSGSEHHQSPFEAVFEDAAIGIALIDMQGHPVKANPALLGMLGYSAEEFRQMVFAEITHPEDREASLDLFGQLIRGERDHYQMEKRYFRKDGRLVWGRLTVSLIRGERDEPLYAIGMVEDITERKHAEDELRRSFDLLQETDEERRRLLSSLVSAQEEERRRIAGEIHDDTIQGITAVGMRIGALRKHLSEEPAARRAVAELEETVSGSIARLRRLLFELHPPALDQPGGLRTALKDDLRRLAEDTGISVTFEEDAVAGELTVERRAICYRIAQEALANVRKHAKATTLEVQAESREGGAFVRIRDDGIGFEPTEVPESVPDHLGLVSMKERAELVGGWCRVHSASGRGTTVEFWVPATATSNRS